MISLEVLGRLRIRGQPYFQSQKNTIENMNYEELTADKQVLTFERLEKISKKEIGIEVSSPGGLPAGLSEKEYLKGNVSILRNPILGNIFYRLHMVEILGTGIVRIKEAYKDSEITDAVPFGKSKTTMLLKRMADKNYVSIIGSGRGTKYKL